MKIVHEFEPTKWRVQKLDNSQWVLVGDYDSEGAAVHRARDIAQTYKKKARVLEMPK
jgi:hypothetical protein